MTTPCKSLTLFLVVLSLVGWLTACGHPMETPQQASIPQDPVTSFKARVEKLREQLGIPGLSIAVRYRQQILFTKGFGYANLEEQIPATPETPYNLASLTKPFAAAVLMKLVEEGRLDLDAELAELLATTAITRGRHTFHGYADACRKLRAASRDSSSRRYASLIGDVRCNSERITVRHLLTHTAQGMPGENYRYNGYLFGFLASVAEAASGKDFDQLLVETIIQPLGMDRTLPSWDEQIKKGLLMERAAYYRKVHSEFVPSGYRTRLSAAAGMVSTVMDLATFDQAMDRNLILSEAGKEAMFTATASNSGRRLPYGLGWFVQQYRGMKLVWHYGYAPKAYSSLILKSLDRDATLILLANSDGASARLGLGAGDVLKSPFASAFIEMLEKMESSP